MRPASSRCRWHRATRSAPPTRCCWSGDDRAGGLPPPRLAASFAPAVVAGAVGNGQHLHLSLRRNGGNLLAGGDGPYGMTEEGESFLAGVLEALPALAAVGAPSVASHLRLVPSHWAGAFRCWGRENRETALRIGHRLHRARRSSRERRGEVLRRQREPLPGGRRPPGGRAVMPGQGSGAAPGGHWRPGPAAGR